MLAYDMPLYRPPSEGDNLIIQVTLGCSFNRCGFCSMYRSKAFEVRPLADVERDVRRAAAVWPEAHRVFLADGDAMTLPTEHLHAILDILHAHLPRLARVSSYATPANILKKSPHDLESLRRRKLSLVYVGVESGDADMLRRITKGASPRGIASALTKARECGIKTSATVILGLGGRTHWRRHIEGTAEVINRAPPNFLSTLQLYLEPAQREDFLATFAKQGDAFVPQDDSAVLEELETLLRALDPPKPVIFRSNHASNALPLAGTLPKDGQRLADTVKAARAGLVTVRPAHRRSL